MILDTGILDEVPIHLVTMEEIMCHVTESIEHSSTLNIGYVNAHVLNLAQSNHELRAQLQSLDICYCDGLGPVLALKAHGFSPTPRLPGRLYIPQLLETAARSGWRVAWIGGERGVLDAAKKDERSTSKSETWCTPRTGFTRKRTGMKLSHRSMPPRRTSCWWEWAVRYRRLGYARIGNGFTYP